MDTDNENQTVTSLLAQLPLASNSDRSHSPASMITKTKEHDDFNNDEIQRTMSGLINDIQSKPTTLSPRERSSSDTGQIPASDNTKTLSDDSTQPQGASSTYFERTNTSNSTTQEESLSLKEKINHDDRPASTRSKQSQLDETRRFGDAPSNSFGSRNQSPVNREQTHRPLSQVRSPSIKDNRTSLDVKSPSPKSNNSRETSSDSRQRTIPTNQQEDRQGSRAPSILGSKSSRQQSPTRVDQRRKSASSNLSTNQESSSLIKPGETLQIPAYNENDNSPPPSPVGIHNLALANPLFVNNSSEKELDRPQSSSISVKRKSATPSEKSKSSQTIVDMNTDKSRRSSKTSQTSKKENIDIISHNRKGSQSSIQQSSSRRQSDVNRGDKPNSRLSFFEQDDQPAAKVDLRRTSTSEQQPTLSRRSSQQKVENNRDNQSISSRHSKGKLPVQAESSSRRSSNVQPIQISLTADLPMSSPTDSDEDQHESTRKQSDPAVPINQRLTSGTSNTNLKLIDNDSKEQRPNQSPHLSATDSHHSESNNSLIRRLSQMSTSTDDEPTTNPTKTVDIVPATYTTDDEGSTGKSERVKKKSPIAEHIDAHSQNSSKKKRKSTGGQKQNDRSHSTLTRSVSTESFNHIPIVDDNSLDTNSGTNTETEAKTRRLIRSTKKDAAANTDLLVDDKTYRIEKSPVNQRTPKGSRQGQSSTSNVQSKPNKDDEKQSSKSSQRHVTKPTEHDDAARHASVAALVDKHKNARKPLPDAVQHHDRGAQSDTEQILTEKQKKRRRPKRISRTTQTYERVFRQMAREVARELRPTIETEKNTQTQKSQLRPKIRSPKKQLPVYLSTDEFKIEEILPKNFPQTQQPVPRTTLVSQNSSAQQGKLLILRPTLPLHHSDAVATRRICLQYAIDLIPTSKTSPTDQTKSLPMIRSATAGNGASDTDAKSPHTNRSPSKDKFSPYRPTRCPF